MDDPFFRIAVRAPSRALADHVVAEAWEAEACGVEEPASLDGRSVQLIIYAQAPRAQRVAAACRAVGQGVVVERPESIESVTWAEAWKQGLTTITVSDRLRIRPSFVEAEPSPEGQRELVIDPGQAFGTGGHASTRLALEWIDALARRPGGPGARVLDVGTGTGVLAMAALALGAERATGHDLDPVATREARTWAARNGLAEVFDVFTGPIEALSGATFDLVVANLLKREVLPIASELAATLRPGGNLVLSGLLRADAPAIERALAPLGVYLREAREVEEGGDDWVSLWLVADPPGGG